MDTTVAPVDPARLDAFMQRFVTEFGAVAGAPLVVLGDRLGLYRAMADSAPVTSAELARRTDCDERYVREWLSQQAASDFVTYDPATETFTLPPEQALAFAVEDGPAFVAGAFEILVALVNDIPEIAERFRSGGGFGWHEHHHALFSGTERFFRPGYAANLVPAWLPALDGVVGKLERGARVADVGCGHGASTIVMAQAYPASRFVGADAHGASIEAARRSSSQAGTAERIEFVGAPAAELAGGPFDLVCIFDALHDMGDPVGAARHLRSQLAPDGTLMVVEPNAGDRLEENLNPVGRVFYAASTMICTPASRSQEVGLALGAQAGEARLTAVLREAGFGRVRRVAETPVNMVLEARP